MKLYRKLTAILLMCGALAVSGTFTACNDDDDDFGTQQYKGGVTLNVWGPRPVARGGELRFLGSGLDKITSITLPGSGDITDIKVISPNEIRITVPQDAQPGYVVLHYAKGEIKSLTQLTFTEPIALDGFTPSVVKPGETLTLTGDYLNLIKEIIFTEEVSVSEDDFITHTRKEITLAVPAEAKTGVIIISDGDPELPNYIYSEEELTVTLPTVESVLDLTGVKPGNEVTVKGENLDLVTKVVMPNGDEVEFTYNDETGEITFVLPLNVSDGTIRIVPASGVEVAAATIGIALPEDVVADPATGIWAGDIIKFKGVNMEIVTEILFPGVEEAVKPESVAPTELSVVVPEGAQSGKAKVYVGSGAFVEVDVKTLCPEAVAYNPSPAALAGNLEVTGRNMQNVKAILFGSTEVEVTSPTETGFTVVVPATISGGNTAISFILTNGETVEAPSLVLDAPKCCYATVLPGDDVELKGGETAVLTVENGDKLTGVKINGTPVQYILNNQTLIVQLPGMAGKNSTLTLVSVNGEISYTINVSPASHVGITIWSGMWDCGSWSGNQDLAWGGYDWSQVPAGAIMTLYMTPTVGAGEWWCVSLRHGQDWGNLPAPIPGQYDTPADGILSVELTKEVLADIVANGGLIFTGQSYVLNRVTLEWDIPSEVTVPFNWSDVDMGDYSINLEGAPGSAFLDAGIQLGQTMRLYCTPTAAYNKAEPGVHIQIFDGHWGGLTFPEINGGGQFNESTWGDMSLIEIKITPELYEKFTTLTDWGYCIIFQGRNIIINKVTLE